MTNVFPIRTDSRLDYQWDWTEWLEDDEIIVTASLTVPDELTLDERVDTDKKITAWFTGAESGMGYKVTCHIETNSTPVSRKESRDIYLVCQ